MPPHTGVVFYYSCSYRSNLGVQCKFNESLRVVQIFINFVKDYEQHLIRVVEGSVENVEIFGHSDPLATLRGIRNFNPNMKTIKI